MEKTAKTMQTPIHPLQTAAWASFRKAMGITMTSVDQWYISFHHIPHTSWTIGYFPKGSMPTKPLIEQLIKVGKEQHALFIQLEPNITINAKLPILNAKYLIPSHHPLFTKYTFVLDLDKSEEELLKEMHPKTRYNIRVAEKHGVTIREDNSDAAFETYLQLAKETTDRQGFYAHGEIYHRTMWRIMHEAGIAHLWTATYEGKVLAAWIIFVEDHVMYYPYGASSRDNREVMAPNLLLWELVKWGKKHDIHTFDLWGAIGPDPDPKDPWYGFHRFKAGYNPTLVEFIGSYDLVIQPFFYKLYCLADTIRWWILKIIK
jgi:lipid II:glycine glycyltransferase (peptidoglycan interpeptide bridge formation enzyme)